MEFRTVDYWDEELWKKGSMIYYQAFGEHGKSEKIIRNMFQKQICYLHVIEQDSTVIAIAITGKLKEVRALLIDYLAVKQDVRNQGIGLQFMDFLKIWCLTEGRFDSMIIEVEAERTSENLARIRFWEKCGFTLTDYIKKYIWVPEPYQAMYHNLHHNAKLPSDGETLFQYIAQFHKQSFSK